MLQKMDNLIQVGKTKIAVRFIVIIFVLINSCAMIKKQDTKSEILLEINFQDFFNGDVVGFKFNDCYVFDTIKLYSDRSTGLTKLQIKILKGEINNYVLYLDKKITCESKKNDPEMTITVNGKEHKYVINMRKGLYLGFSKKDQQDLFFYQSITPFEYD
jgi:hypothetical protein